MKIDSFTDEVHAALRRLYEPQFLRKSPLVQWLEIAQAGDSVQALRKTLTDAIQSLKPSPRAHLESSEYRSYQILLSRFLDQAGQKEVASDLGVSERQLRRLESEAVRAVSETLWAKHAARLEMIRDEQPDGNASAIGASSQFELADGANEIERLKATFPPERVELRQLIQATHRTIEPLSARLKVQMDFQLPLQDVFIEGPVEVIRQVLLNLLAAGAQAAPGGTVTLEIQRSPMATVVNVSAAGASLAESPLRDEIVEKIELTSRLIAPFGGVIETQVIQGDPGKLLASFKVPSATTIHVLAVEDNEDLIKLYERYLYGTRYTLVSASDPGMISNLIEEFSPQVILLDVMMPSCDGWQILGQLRENPATSHIPLVICSILPQESLAYALGAADYIRKPVKRETFLQVLDQQVESGSQRPG
jgi:CheY-like chemotaxis protein